SCVSCGLTTKLRHSRRKPAWPAMMMFKFHVSVKTEGAAAVACSDLLGSDIVYFSFKPENQPHRPIPTTMQPTITNTKLGVSIRPPNAIRMAPARTKMEALICFMELYGSMPPNDPKLSHADGRAAPQSQ